MFATVLKPNIRKIHVMQGVSVLDDYRWKIKVRLNKGTFGHCVKHAIHICTGN